MTITPLFPSREPPKRIRLVLVDDHTLFRETLRIALSREFDLEIVGEAGNGLTGQEIATEQNPDIVLMDIAMPLVGGIDATRQLQQNHPEIGVIILSAHAEEGNVLQALQVGARGFFPKSINLATLIRAIRAVATGESVIDTSLTGDVLGELRRLSPGQVRGFGGLTVTEQAILSYLAAGSSNKEIAWAVSLVESTVKNSLTIIYKKLGVHDRTQAAIYALRHGIAGQSVPLRVWVKRVA